MVRCTAISRPTGKSNALPAGARRQQSASVSVFWALDQPSLNSVIVPPPIVGVVTSLKEEHENSASRIFSNDRDCLAPHVHSRRAKGSVRPCRNEMTLDVESVVGGRVS